MLLQQQSQGSVTTSYVRGGIRGRGRGRGGNTGSGATRRDYGSRQQNTQEVQQPVVDQQAMLQQNYYYYHPYFTPQHMQVGIPPSAQHATGTLTGQPLYASNNMMPATYIPTHQIYGYPNVIYPPMVPHEYSLVEGKVDESPENAMQQMWHPVPIEYAEHQQIEHAMHQQHPEEFMQHEDMEDYNYNQNIDHNSPHMLSPMYKDDQPYQQLHLSSEFVPNVQQPLVHLSPQHQQIIEAQQQQQQQQQMVINQQHPQQFSEALSGNEFDQSNNAEESNTGTPNVNMSNQHENDYHTSIDSFNNNIDDKNIPIIENSQPKIIASEGVKVPVVTTINNNSLKGSNSSSNNSNTGGGVSGGGSDNNSAESTSVVPKPMQMNSVQVQSNAVISTADLNKLATSVNEKLIIKNDRAPSKQLSTNSWNRKNTTSVAVSAVPNSYPPPPFQATVTRNTETSTITNYKPTVPKSENNLTKETKEQTADASLEQSQKSHSVNTSTSNSHQSSIESRSVKVEVIPRLDSNSLIVNSSENILSMTKTNVNDGSVQSPLGQIQLPSVTPSVNESSIPVVSTPATPQTWAGLFAPKVGYATRTHSDSTARKPVAKVSPFETSLNNAPQINYTPEGQLSYSAASSQGLPTPSSNVSLGTGAHKKTISKATVAPSKATVAPQGDESSLKMGGK